MTIADVRGTLLRIQEQYGECTECYAHQFRTGQTYGSWKNHRGGDVGRTIMIVLDRIDLDTLYSRRVPSGDFSEILQYLLGKIGLTLADVWVTPIALCPSIPRPNPDEWPPLEVVPVVKKSAWVACRPRLHREILYLEPEVVIAMGNNVSKALWPKIHPKYHPSLGKIRDLRIPGKLGTRTVPVLITHSILELHKTRDLSHGGLWNKAYDHFQEAHKIGTYLQKLRNG